MPRPKSDDRRAALLDAATAVFAESGLAAPTSLVSKRAGVSEGSLFTYFKTKDELVNEVYRDIRLQVAHAVVADFPRRGSMKARLEHTWNRYVDWGAEHPVARRALKIVSVAHAITPETRAESGVLFAEVDRLYADARAMLGDLRQEMVTGALNALAIMTMDQIERYPEEAETLRAAGFRMLWAALGGRR